MKKALNRQLLLESYKKKENGKYGWIMWFLNLDCMGCELLKYRVEIMVHKLHDSYL